MPGPPIFGDMDDRSSVGLLGRLREQDLRALGYVVGRRHPRLDRTVRLLTHVGDAPVMVGVALVLMALPWAVAHRAGVRAGTALVVSHLLVQALKRTISRERPRLPVGVASLIQPPDRFSFPSGHAAAALSVTAAIATAVALPLGIALLAIGLVVGITRCYVGVHYPGDVLAGWLLGLSGVLVSVVLL